MAENYDLIIVGAGPAGLTAGIFAVRRKLKTVILENQAIGGQMAYATRIENYPGITKINGIELAEKMRKQAEHFGCKIIREKAVELRLVGEEKVVRTEKNTYSAGAVILATGSAYRHLGIPGEKELIGKGVSYCASCDAPLFKGKKIAVIGGSNAAATAALFLKDYASKVYLVHRRDELRADEILGEQLKKAGVEILWDNIAKKIKGKDSVEGIVVENVKTKKQEIMPVDGVFIYIGTVPITEIAERAGVRLNEQGFIETNEDQETNLESVYAAGDVTGGIMQIAQAVGHGAIAATNAYCYIKNR